MNCRKVKARLLEYLSNELPDELNQTFDAHIKSCPTCQKEHDELKKTFNLFDQLSPIELPPEQQQKFLFEIRRRLQLPIKTRPTRRQWRWLLPRLVPTLAAGAVLIFFVTTRFKSSENKYAKLAANIFTSPDLSLSGKFVNDYFKANGGENILNEELSQLSPGLIEEVKSYLSNQLEIGDLVEGMTESEKLQLVQKIEEQL